MAKYTLYIDESGDAGIQKVRDNNQNGATPYFVFGAVLIKNTSYADICQSIDRIAASLNTKFLHCRNLNHPQKKYFAREIATQPMVLFGLISRKETLGNYKNYIQADVMRYHNKCAGYLLECVGEFMASNRLTPEDLNIYFERGPFDYNALGNYIRVCQGNPQYPRNKLLRNIQANRINTRTKDEEPLFQISDLVAHSLFRSVDINDASYGIPETQYLVELHSRFYHDAITKKITDFGFRAVQGLTKAQIPNEVVNLLGSGPINFGSGHAG